MKIFEFRFGDGERTWITANTNIHALITMAGMEDWNMTDLDELDEIIEIPGSEWENYNIVDEDGEPFMTFKECVEEYNFPDIICSTIDLWEAGK